MSRPARAPAKVVRPAALLTEVRDLILGAREQTARVVNAGLTLLHWQLGDRIRREVLAEKRAGYGERIVSGLGERLESEFGRGFTEKNLRRMVQFAEVFPDREIVVSLIRQLTWTHFIALLPLKDALQREFYAEMCRIERWSVRELRARIDSMLFERTAISRKPKKLIEKEITGLRKEDRITPDLVFRDPYVLDFLGLRDTYSEKALKDAILREVESFLLALGDGFAFVERQKRITLDGDDYYLDLLFFHRRLRRLVAIELKIGTFKPADAGQIELYLRWLDRNERQKGEEKPIGIILCAGTKRDTVEVLELEPRGIHVAEYLTELPPRKVLEQRLREAVVRTRRQLEQRASEEVSTKGTAAQKKGPKRSSKPRG